jgi:putative hemolysin
VNAILTEIIVVILLVLANAVFSGAEIAIIALRKSRIEELAEQGKRSALDVLALREDPERFLATVQVGITVVGATAAAFGGESIATRLAPELARVPWIGERSGALALGIVIAGISYLSIVLGELVPKSLALRSAEQYALLVSKPLLGLSILAKPLVWLLGTSANLVLKPFGDTTTFTETRHSAEELQELVEEAAKAGTIHPEAGEIAARALELPALTASDVMVPRREVVALSQHASAQDLRAATLARKHNRLPVYNEMIDNVVGYVNVKDLLAQACEGGTIELDAVMRQAHFVPESQNAVELLKEMRGGHIPLAIVVDEQGGTAGIVTMEDLLEELVGEIFSEHAREVPVRIKRQPDGSALVSGLTHVREVNRELGLDLPEQGEWTTIAGLCLANAGKIPAIGDSVGVNGVRLEITDASARRIRAVRVVAP